MSTSVQPEHHEDRQDSESLPPSSLKRTTYRILGVARPGDRASEAFDTFMIALIFANVVAVVLETIEPLHRSARPFFDAFELVSVILFSAEYVLRLWSCTENGDFRSPVLGRLRYAATPFLLIDLFAVLPYYLPLFGIDLRFMRAVRLFRLARFAKFARYSRVLRTFGRVVSARKEELVTTLSLVALLLLMASSLMYFAEHDAQPEAFASIPSAMWWGVATLTTVGYGDVYPITAWGRLIAALVAVLGIGMFALPAGILGSAFVEELQQPSEAPALCPHCGGKID